MKGSLPVMSALQPPPLSSALVVHVRQPAGGRLEGLEGTQLRQELISPSVLIARSEQLFVFFSLEIESNSLNV